jgi:uncharacterized membrane protein YeaQ/YmgE (transglycosylase-associated protein family)
MFRILGALVSGFIIGLLARWLYPASVHLHAGTTILLGIGGSLLAQIVSARSGAGRSAGLIASIVGAMALIFIGRHLG